MFSASKCTPSSPYSRTVAHTEDDNRIQEQTENIPGSIGNGSPLGTRTGVLHEYGLGVPKDQHRAAEWHVLAAEQGLGESQYHLGLMKAHGRGSSQDFSSAVIHFQKVS